MRWLEEWGFTKDNSAGIYSRLLKVLLVAPCNASEVAEVEFGEYVVLVMEVGLINSREFHRWEDLLEIVSLVEEVGFFQWN